MINHRTILILTSLLAGLMIIGLFVLNQVLSDFNIKQYSIAVVVAILAMIQLNIAYKKYTMEKSGLTVEDELSNKLKYQAGYRAYFASLYMWLFMFLFKDVFPDPDLVIPVGIIVSAIMGGVLKLVVKHQINEE